MRFLQLAVGPLGANCYIIWDESVREAIVVDPGGDSDRILRTLAEKQLKAIWIVNTHGHVDHIGANAALAEASGAKVAIHADDASMLVDPELNLSAFTGGGISASPADRILHDGDVVAVGGVSLVVVHTPGHTPGGICLYGEGRLFSGDTLFAGSVGRTDLPGGATAVLLDSIHERLLVLPDETEVYPGHGPRTSVGEERRSNPFI